METIMKSLVLLTFLSLSPDAPSTTGKAEFFDNEQACQVRMQEIRTLHSAPGSVRCSCHKTVEQVEAEGNDAI
jgi:hypothetical protein